jgi:N-acetylmuramoyl-L-alanine amidase-like protein
MKIRRPAGFILSSLLIIIFLYFNFIKPRWKYIIIHHSSTKIGGVRIFRNGHEDRGGAWLFNDPMYYHLVIGNGHGAGNGELQKGVRWKRQQLGGGCCTLKGLSKVKKISDLPKAYSDYFNFTGIHICLVGEFNEKDPSTKQLAMLSSVVMELCRKYNIEPGRIRGHREVQMAPTDCPGSHFPLTRFRNQMRKCIKCGLKGRDNPHLFNWKIRIVNFWPLLGILIGEVYFSMTLMIFDIILLILFFKLTLPLCREKKISADEEIYPGSEIYEEVEFASDENLHEEKDDTCGDIYPDVEIKSEKNEISD